MDSVFKLGVVVSVSDLASSAISDINGKWDALKKTLSDARAEVLKVESSMKLAIGGGLAVGAAFKINSAISASVDEARKFEKEMALLGATANASALDMKKFSEIALNTGLNTAFSPQEAAQGLTALASAGIEGTRAISDALLPALDMAAASAGKLSIDQAASDMAATMMSFKNQGASARSVVDSFVNMANVASFSIQDLGAAWRGVNLAASSTNQSLSTTGAVMSALKNAGSTAIESGEGVRMALTALKAPSDLSKKALDELKVSAYDSNGKFKDLITIFRELETATSSMTEADRNARLQKILHEGGMKAFQAVTGQGISKVLEWKSTLEKSGSAAEFAKRQLETYDGTLKILEGSWQTLKVVLGNVFLPVLSVLSIGFNSLVSGVARFAKENEGLTKMFGWVAVGLSGVLAFGGAFMVLRSSYIVLNALVSHNIALNALASVSYKALSAVKNIFSFSQIANTAAVHANTLSHQMNIATTHASTLSHQIHIVAMGILFGKVSLVTAAQWAWNTALAANPIGVAIVGIAALSVGVYVLAKNWDAVTNAFHKSWSWIENNKVAVSVLALAFAPLTLAVGVFGSAIYALVKHWDSVSDAIKKAFSWVKKFFGIEDSESDKIQSSLDSVSNKIKGLEDKKSQLQKMGYSDNDSEIKNLNDQLKKAQSEQKGLTKQFEGSQNFENAVKVINEKKKLVESALGQAQKSGNLSEADSLKKRLEEINAEKKKISDSKMDFFKVDESSKIKDTLDDIDARIKGLNDKKANLGALGISDKSAEMKKINDELKKTESERKGVSKVFEGTKTFESSLKSLEDQKKALESALGKSDKAFDAGQSEVLKKRIEEVKKEKEKLNLADIMKSQSGIDKTANSVKNLNKALGELDYSKLNNEAVVMKNLENMKKLNEQSYYSGKSLVSTFNAGITHQSATDGSKGVIKLAESVSNQLPHSDAKEGPLSKLSASGKALVSTFESGIEKELGGSSIMSEFAMKFLPNQSLRDELDLKSNRIESSVVTNNSDKGTSLSIGSLLSGDVHVNDVDSLGELIKQIFTKGIMDEIGVES